MIKRVSSGTLILVIDDSEELLEVLSLILEKQGHRTIIKNSSDNIGAFVQENRIDLLLLDVVLKGTNGRDVCKKLKSDPATNYFPIILMSVTYRHLVDHKECLADDFIEKPFNLQLLVQKINSSLDGKQER